MALSPTDYIRAAGGRRSSAVRAVAGPVVSGPIVAYDGMDLNDPRLLEMMRGDGGRTGVAGIAVSDRMAMRNSTFFRAVSLISGSMGMLPTHLMRLKADGTREKARDHPLFNVLHRKANDYQTATGADAVALLDVTGAAVRVQADGYDRTTEVAAGAITFLDLPLVTGRVTVTIAGTGQVSVGTLLVGRLRSLGITEASPTAGITDYSRKAVDDFGDVTVVQRAWSKRMAAKALIRTDAVDVVANRIAAVRARPSLWIGQAGLDSLTVYGFFKDFSIEVGVNVSKLSLTIEGLSKAAPVVPFAPGGSVAWPDVTDPTGTKPTDNADVTGDNTSKDTNAVGGKPATDLLKSLDDLEKVTIPAVNAAVAQADARITAAAGEAAAAVAEANEQIVAANGRVTAAQATLDQAVTDLNAEISRAQGKDEQLSQRIDALIVEGNGYDDTNVRALIEQAETVRADGDRALAERIDRVVTSYQDLDTATNTRITDTAQALANADRALGQRIDAVTADYQGRDVATNARVTGTATVLVAADQALGQRIDTVTADYQGRDSATNTRITDKTTALANADEAIGQRISEVQSGFTSGGGNLLSNTDFVTLDGWATGYSGSPPLFAINVAGDAYHPINENTLGIRQDGRVEDEGDIYYQWLSSAVPVTAGTYIQYSAMCASHRANTRAIIAWVNLAGAVVGFDLNANVNSSTDDLANDPKKFKRSGVLSAIVPDGVVAAILCLRKENTYDGQGDSYAWFWRPYIGGARQRQNAWNDWSPGSGRAVQIATDARVSTSITTLANADQALGQRIDSVTADYQGRDANTNARVDQVATASANANQAVADLSTTVSTRFDGVNLTLSGYDQRISSLSTDQQGYVGRTSSLEAQMSRQAPSALNSFTDDVNNRLTQVDTNVNARIKSSEDVIADLPNRYAAASRTATLEAQLAYQLPSGISNAIGAVDGRVTDTSNTLVARIEDRATAIADAKAGAVASTLSQLRAEYNGTAASVTQQAGAIVNLQGKASAYVRLVADAGNGRAALSLWSDQYGGAWTLTGDGQIDGNLTVNGTITARKFDRTSMSREGTATWSGSITPSTGQVVTVPWSLSLTQIPPVGRFIYELVTAVSTNAGQRDVSTRNGRPFYTDHIADGGLVIGAIDGQGNSYVPAPNSSQAVLSSTDFVPSWSATVRNGGYDSGITDQGDYYLREISASYTATYISLKVTWVAI